MKTTPGFNPFIVLSDVTICLLVLMIALLMMLSAFAVYSSTLAESHKEKLEQKTNDLKQMTDARDKLQKDLDVIKTEKKSLLDAITTNQSELDTAFHELPQRAEWARKGLRVAFARGTQSCIFRFDGHDLFSKTNGMELSTTGREAMRAWGRALGDRLQGQKDKPVGALCEIIVRGHCRNTGEPWTVSSQRALSAAAALRSVPGFPDYLLVVCGASYHRRVFLSVDDIVRKKRKDFPGLSDDEILQRLIGTFKGDPLEDRIDLRLTYSGLNTEKDYIPAWDGRKLHGPTNVLAIPIIQRNDELERREAPR